MVFNNSCMLIECDIVRTVALYYPGTSLLDFECPGCEPLQWQGGQVPIAKRVFKLRVVSIEPAAFLAMSSLAVVGITLALAFLVFNLHFRKLKFLTDDRRELQYRVEIQNKVYRREVAALDLEIGRLERQLLEINSVSCSSSTSSIRTMPRKMDMYAVEEGNVNYQQQQQQYQHPRTPSIGGGLPLLLLSVLPPVIPRASWPSAVQELPMRRSVTFSSEPKLDEQHNKQRSQSRNRQPAIDLYNLCLRPERFNEKLGVLGRIKNFFGSRTSIRSDIKLANTTIMPLVMTTL
ncbi:metabotropic GABA-B receptor subtype 3 [Carabus blaptoides fortunei]